LQSPTSPDRHRVMRALYSIAAHTSRDEGRHHLLVRIDRARTAPVLARMIGDRRHARSRPPLEHIQLRGSRGVSYPKRLLTPGCAWLMAVAAASQPVLRRLRLVLPHALRLAPLSRCPRLPSLRFGRLRALVVRRASVARRLPPAGSALRFAL